MQKRFLVLPAVLTAAACGQLSRPATTPAPRQQALTFESPGELSRSAPAAPIHTAPANGRNPVTIGEFIRARAAQMNFCYQEGLATNPKLAGAVEVALTITSTGDVTDAAVVNRSWSGQGTDEAESCIRARARTWKFPRSKAPTGTYPFSLSFTR